MGIARMSASLFFAACVLVLSCHVDNYVQADKYDNPTLISAKDSNDDESLADCLLPPDGGKCRALFIRWYYNKDTDTCQEFRYGGCNGNGNNFSTKKQCIKSCKGTLEK